ncbi:histone-lysine N-methyltransferase ASHH2 [Pelomyxa schiedti]|nr:histone-lysine N-methyltransferase ASHH2 [Pelomyxa schiedti]
MSWQRHVRPCKQAANESLKSFMTEQAYKASTSNNNNANNKPPPPAHVHSEHPRRITDDMVPLATSKPASDDRKSMPKRPRVAATSTTSTSSTLASTVAAGATSSSTAKAVGQLDKTKLPTKPSSSDTKAHTSSTHPTTTKPPSSKPLPSCKPTDTKCDKKPLNATQSTHTNTTVKSNLSSTTNVKTVPPSKPNTSGTATKPPAPPNLKPMSLILPKHCAPPSKTLATSHTVTKPHIAHLPIKSSTAGEDGPNLPQKRVASPPGSQTTEPPHKAPRCEPSPSNGPQANNPQNKGDTPEKKGATDANQKETKATENKEETAKKEIPKCTDTTVTTPELKSSLKASRDGTTPQQVDGGEQKVKLDKDKDINKDSDKEKDKYKGKSEDEDQTHVHETKVKREMKKKKHYEKEKSKYHDKEKKRGKHKVKIEKPGRKPHKEIHTRRKPGRPRSQKIRRGRKPKDSTKSKKYVPEPVQIESGQPICEKLPMEMRDDGDRSFAFQYITTNLYNHRQRKNESDGLTVCGCTPIQGEPCCGASCINRAMHYECFAELCPCKDKCTNRRFQNKEYVVVIPFKTAERGYGLLTLQDILPGQFIIEYVGEVITKQESEKRLSRSKPNDNFYLISLDSNECLDASHKGNLARFMNHSCQPNCKTTKWTVLNELCVGIFAMQYIPAGSELTFDYQFERIGVCKQACRCGAANCRGYLGAPKNGGSVDGPLPSSPSSSLPPTRPSSPSSPSSSSSSSSCSSSSSSSDSDSSSAEEDPKSVVLDAGAKQDVPQSNTTSTTSTSVVSGSSVSEPPPEKPRFSWPDPEKVLRAQRAKRRARKLEALKNSTTPGTDLADDKPDNVTSPAEYTVTSPGNRIFIITTPMDSSKISLNIHEEPSPMADDPITEEPVSPISTNSSSSLPISPKTPSPMTPTSNPYYTYPSPQEEQSHPEATPTPTSTPPHSPIPVATPSPTSTPPHSPTIIPKEEERGIVNTPELLPTEPPTEKIEGPHPDQSPTHHFCCEAAADSIADMSQDKTDYVHNLIEEGESSIGTLGRDQWVKVDSTEDTSVMSTSHTEENTNPPSEPEPSLHHQDPQNLNC